MNGIPAGSCVSQLHLSYLCCRRGTLHASATHTLTQGKRQAALNGVAVNDMQKQRAGDERGAKLSGTHVSARRLFSSSRRWFSSITSRTRLSGGLEGRSEVSLSTEGVFSRPRRESAWEAAKEWSRSTEAVLLASSISLVALRTAFQVSKPAYVLKHLMCMHQQLTSPMGLTCPMGCDRCGARWVRCCLLCD